MKLRRQTRATLCAIALFVLALTSLAWHADARRTEEPLQDLSRQAYAVLKQNCFACHGAAKTSGLDLRTAEGIRAGGETGQVLVPTDPQASRLFLLVTHQEKPTMPPGKKLSDAEIDVLRHWIEAGASLDAFDAAGTATKAEESAGIPDRGFSPEERSFWAFKLPKQVSVPKVPHAANAIDAFLLDKMAAKRLTPSPKADRRTLVRRAYLDLTGLPPSPEEVSTFLNDKSADAYPKLVDRLLASPHYGERWARHWLDVVRYADSGGFEFDYDRPDAWRYRDYVVNAFNSDKPYDQFIREQLAGDEYVPASREAMTATGFLRLGPEGEDRSERGRQDALDDQITTTSLTFMGLTVGCARCHDHKFDPIPQKDFYRIQAIFAPTRPLSFPLVDASVVAAHRAETQRIDGLARPLKKEKEQLEAPYLKVLVEEAVNRLPEYMQTAWRTPEDQRTPGQRLNVAQIRKTLENDSLSQRLTEKDIIARMSDEDRKKHEQVAERVKEVEKQKPGPFPTVRSVGEGGANPGPTYFLLRGAPEAKGPAVTPGVLSVVSETEYKFPSPPSDAKSSFRRRGLAEWLVSPSNPLTSRVMVNRIWQHHFGEGIVRTPSNFGKMGERPSHPELLDWLALEFIRQGWSVKQMHRLMMLSQAYQMSSNDIPTNVNIDPENRMFWRMPRLRLEAEIIRDQILAVAGNLDRALGGPCVYPYIDPKLFQSSTKRTWPGKRDDDPSTWRRSLYVYSKRSIRYPLFETFDQPNLINSCERRNRSTIAPQALLLMNNNFAIMESKLFAERLRKDAGDNVTAQVDRAYQLALGRLPTKFEQTKTVAFVKASGLEQFCLAMFNLNEFVYRQ